MANSTKSSTSTKSSSTSTKRSSVWSLNKVSMYTLVFVAILYVVSLILGCVDLGNIGHTVVGALNGVATAIMIIIVAILAWRYVRPKQMVWKVLYVLCLLLVIVGVIIPLIVMK